MDRKGASLDKKKVRNWAPKFLEKKGAKLDKKGAKSETSHLPWGGRGGGLNLPHQTNIANYVIFCLENLFLLLFDFYYYMVRQFLAEKIIKIFWEKPTFGPLAFFV